MVIFCQDRQFLCLPVCLPAKSAPSEKGSTPIGVQIRFFLFFFIEWILCHEGGKTSLTVLTPLKVY